MIDDNTPERGKSQVWLEKIDKAETVFRDWQDAADNIDKAYADLSNLRGPLRDKEFQLFWANIQIMGPAIYARPPVPVVTPRFKDRRPLYRTASEMLERTCVVSFDMADIDQHMLELRNDLAIVGRGAAWVRYESDDDGERVHYEHVDRKDFLHDPQRRWCDVDWVARRAWLTTQEVEDRFGEDVALEMDYQTRRNENISSEQKCGIWEIWCKSEDRVVWVTEGYEKTLEESDPHLKLQGFFPCPKPAYATLQPRSLIPIPDMLFYKDQLDEVNSLTRRIHALADSIKVRGFYAGSGDIGEAIESAIKLADDEQVLIPVPAMQSLMQGGGEPIMWLPLDMVAQTITGLIELRRQVIEDVYQIVGLSDIMRGQSQADETYGAQRIKQQNGSARVRDKQSELVRVARDLARLGAEIMAEEFSKDTLIDMAQMDLPTAADVKKQIEGFERSAREELEALMEQAEQAMGQMQQPMQEGQGQPDPAQAEQQFEAQQQQIIAKWQGQIQEAGQAITIDAVTEFLADEKMRPFVLDIETDSTIYPDEMAEKESRQEFMAAFANSMGALMPMFQMGPEAISVAGGVFKFALSPYRVGRELEGLIDDFVDEAPAIAERLQAEGGDGEELAAAQKALADAEMVKAQAAMEGVKARAMQSEAENERKIGELQMKAGQAEQDAQEKMGKLQLSMSKQEQDFAAKMAETDAKVDKMRAETAKILESIGLDARKQSLEEYRAAETSRDKEFNKAVTLHEKTQPNPEPEEP